ncbi:PREDICTED: olfactory receptor 52K1-like [Nanorana parkeri]|uniref:olfactory receptor 52K1-like n=1 Tax=Nanorana parkeri TaxID=125878 RepID=UPI0008548C76|nr:PREDICTED: olfactory receptor 52K1-like [Nanorana parkeri]
MSSINLSVFYPSVFVLEGLPGFEWAHVWISIPIFIMYLMALLGNSLLLFLIATVKQLQSPMYYFLFTLFITDVTVSSTIVLKMLPIFWMNLKEISFLSCLVQMFFVHYFSALESGILLAMAYDRYVAICDPLHYTTTLTNTLILKIIIVLLIRGVIIVTPCPVLASRLPYCQTHHIAHCYCDHMAVVTLACTNITINSLFGLTAVLLVIVVDVSLIAVSYFFILRTVLKLSSRAAKHKAFSTCTSHVCIFLTSYTLGLFSSVTYRIGNINPNIHIMMSVFYVLIPPAINPIIYGVKTKEIRSAVYNLISRSAK